MTKKKTPAPAASPDVAKAKKPELTKGVTLTRIKTDGVSAPCALFDGEAPRKGERLTFKLKNGVTYTGLVADATEADGNVLVEFKDGIAPVVKP